jgi:hypothetical protein
MNEPITLPISSFEIEFKFDSPDLMVWLDRAKIVQAVWQSLKPWNIAIDDLEPITTGKPSEQGVKFKIPQKLSSFFIGAASCKFTRDAMNWGLAEETITIIDTVLKAFLSQTKLKVVKRKTVLVMHAQPKNVPFMQILRPLAPAQLLALETEAPRTMASVVAWDKRKVTLDGSASLANGIFIRLEREFDGDITYQEMAERLLKDEQELAAALGIEEEQ